MRQHKLRVGMRRWKRRVAQRVADAALKRASMALGTRLARARALRQWSALRLARQQGEIAKLHQVAQWHLQTLLGATSNVGERHDPVLAVRQLVKKWSNALVMRVWNAWRQFVAEEAGAPSQPRPPTSAYLPPSASSSPHPSSLPGASVFATAPLPSSTCRRPTPIVYLQLR